MSLATISNSFSYLSNTKLLIMPASGVSKKLYLSTFELYCVMYCFHFALFLGLVIWVDYFFILFRVSWHYLDKTFFFYFLFLIFFSIEVNELGKKIWQKLQLRRNPRFHLQTVMPFNDSWCYLERELQFIFFLILDLHWISKIWWISWIQQETVKHDWRIFKIFLEMCLWQNGYNWWSVGLEFKWTGSFFTLNFLSFN